MIIGGVIIGAANGSQSMALIANGAVESTKEAVELGISMLGVVGMWSGVMNIAEKSGLIRRISARLEPLIDFLFVGIPKESSVRGDIATNIIANIFGLGWAATPSGLRAVKKLNELDRREYANNNICTLLVLNISSLQLIPVNMIAYRSQYGSVNPGMIIAPAIIATTLSTISAVILCKIFNKSAHDL